MTTSGLVPLQNSWANNSLESDLKQLTVDLYTNNLKASADAINVYGAPYLGTADLVKKFIQQDGLTIINTDNDTDQMYVFKAWRYRNPRRGLHFARLYLQTLYPNNFTIDQLWQKTSAPYPTSLATTNDMADYGYNPASYWRTSRVRVDLTTTANVPVQILTSLRTTLAARFVLELRVKASMATETGTATVMTACQIVRTVSNAAPGVPMGSESIRMSPLYMGAANVAYLAGQR